MTRSRESRRRGRLLSARPFPTDRPSQYPIDALHRALVAAGCTEVRSSVNAGRALRRLPAFNPGRLRRHITVVGLMGPRDRDLAAHTVHGPAVAFCWDVWPATLRDWDQMLRRHPVAMVMASSRQAAAALRAEGLDVPVHHLPEATEPGRYEPGTPLVDRTIGVLELGRRWEEWHASVTPALVAAGARHLYQPTEHELVFDDAPAMRRGLSDSVVSVCVPSSTTHPGRSGTFRTVTHRYFESMASGCVVLGEAPEELVDLFGYNPVIEIDWSDPTGQVLDILADPARHQALVDRNLSRVRTVGSWSARVVDLLALIDRELP
jgi:hypothetical protein